MCVAGIDLESGLHVRPVRDRQMTIDMLSVHGGPFDIARVIDLGQTRFAGKVPKVEDQSFDARRSGTPVTCRATNSGTSSSSLPKRNSARSYVPTWSASVQLVPLPKRPNSARWAAIGPPPNGCFWISIATVGECDSHGKQAATHSTCRSPISGCMPRITSRVRDDSPPARGPACRSDADSRQRRPFAPVPQIRRRSTAALAADPQLSLARKPVLGSSIES